MTAKIYRGCLITWSIAWSSTQQDAYEPHGFEAYELTRANFTVFVPVLIGMARGVAGWLIRNGRITHSVVPNHCVAARADSEQCAWKLGSGFQSPTFRFVWPASKMALLGT